MRNRRHWSYSEAEANMWIGAITLTLLSVVFCALGVYVWLPFYPLGLSTVILGPMWGVWCRRQVDD